MARVLVIDDEKSIRETFTAFLENAGHSTYSASQADEAMDLLAQHEFDVAVCDIVLPRISGTELLRKMRSVYENLQVIMITGEPSYETASEAVRGGAFDYIDKPVTRDELVATVARAADVKSLLDERSRLQEQNLTYQRRLEELLEERNTQLQETQQRLQLFADSVPMLIAYIDRDRRYRYVNAAYERALGLTSAQIIGTHVGEVSLPIEYEQIESSFESALSGHPVSYEGKYTHRTKGQRSFRAYLTPHVNEAGSVEGLFACSLDITEETAAQEELTQQEAYYRSLMYSLHEDILVIDRDYRIVDLNNTTLVTSGQSREEVIGQPCFVISHGYHEPCDNLGENCELKRVFETGEPRNCTHEHIRSDGSKAYVDILLSPLNDADGNVSHVIEAVRDISELYVTQNRLRELSSRQEAVLAAVPDIIMEVDNEKTYTWANRAGYEFFGEDCIGKEASEFFEGEQNTYEIVAPLFNGQENVIYVESWQRRRDGEVRLLAWWCRVLKDENGNVAGAISTARDITDRRQAEDDATRMGRVLEEALNEIYIFDCDTLKFQQVNRGARDNLGYSMDELRQLTPLDLKPEFTPSAFEAMIEPLRTGDIPILTFTTLHRRKDRTDYPVEVHLQLFAESEPAVFVAIIQDITDRTAAEQQLALHSERLEQEVDRRTRELRKTVDLMAGREVRMAELKKTIASLRTQLREAGIQPAEDQSKAEPRWKSADE